MRIRFDTRDKKPTVWDIAILSAVAAAVLTALVWDRDRISFTAVNYTLRIYLVLTLLCLITAFFKQLQYNPYSYNTIYYSGFSLFLLAMLISQIVIFHRNRYYQWTTPEALATTFSMVLSSARNYMIYSSPFILLFSAALCVSNISLIRHEGKRLVNILGIILSVLMVGGELFLFIGDSYVSGSMREVMMHDLLFNLFACMYLYYECMLIGTIIANLIVINYKPDYDRDFIIILGCGIRRDGTPTPLLAGRVDRAMSFADEQQRETGKAPVFVASGGQGPDEVVPESEAMKNYLLSKGVPAERILTEDRSGDTHENMLYSKEIIQAADPAAKVLYATTNYHVFRSGLMARRVKMRAVGIGAKTKWYFWPNATVREFVGLLTEHRLKQALILGGMILIYTSMTLVFYLMP